MIKGTRNRNFKYPTPPKIALSPEQKLYQEILAGHRQAGYVPQPNPYPTKRNGYVIVK